MEHIWLADDDKDARDDFRMALEEIAPATLLTSIENGEVLLQLLSSGKPDLLFLDLNMPCKNGLTCLKEIRGNKSLLFLPVVAFCNGNTPAEINVAYGFGAHLYLQKPNTYGKLVSALRHILQLDWSRPELVTEKQFSSNSFLPFVLPY